MPKFICLYTNVRLFENASRPQNQNIELCCIFSWSGKEQLEKCFFQDVTEFSQIRVELEMLVDGLTSPWAGEDWPKAQALLDLNPSQCVI